MLYVPLAAGICVAGAVSIPLVLFILAVSFVFISRESLVTWWRARARNRKDPDSLRLLITYLALSLLSGAPLLVIWRLYWLIPAGAATILLLLLNTVQAVRREERTIAGEIIAIAGLTMTAPAAHYVASGTLESTAFWLWGLSAAYFASSVFYVKLRVNTINPHREVERRKSWRRCAAYHAFLLTALLIFGFAGELNLFVLVAFTPILVRSFWHLTRPVRKINLRLVGWLEIGYSMVFLLFTTLTFRL